MSLEAIEQIARTEGVLELQASFGTKTDPSLWEVTISTYQHGAPLEPGSMTGAGRGTGRTLEDAAVGATEDYRRSISNPEPEVYS